MQTPSMGRIVLCRIDEMRTRPAIITEVLHVDSGSVDLSLLLSPNDPEFCDGVSLKPVIAKSNVQFDPDGAIGTWHWPPRV